MTVPHIREARYWDLPEVAHINTRAFWDDDIVGDRIHPFREKYPQDVDLYFLRRARVKFFDLCCAFLLVISLDSSGQETIAGYAQVAEREGRKSVGISLA